MVRPRFVLSYNNSKGGPNLASWHLKRSDIGTISRGDFHVDTSLPAGFVRITKADYNNSGVDRGHLRGFKSAGQAQRFLSAFGLISSLPSGSTPLHDNLLPGSNENQIAVWEDVN